MKPIPVLIFCLYTVFAHAQVNIDSTATMFRYQNKMSLSADQQDYKPLGAVKWKLKTNGKVFSSPVIWKDLVFVGSEDGNLYAADAMSGKLKWQYATWGAVNSSPAVSNGTVYFGSFDGYFYAVDVITGKLKWKFKTGGEKRMGDKAYWGMKPPEMYMEDLWDCFLSSPILSESAVYFGSSDAHVYALDTKTGSVKWKFKTSGSIHSSPALDNGTVYIGSWDAFLYAIDAKTGVEKWRFKTGEQPAMTGIQSSPVVENNVIYFGARDASLYALYADDGAPVWKYDAHGSWIISSAVVRNGSIYVGTSDSFLLLALDAKTGKEIYRLKTNGYIFGTPAVVNGTAYVGDYTGNMYSLDLASNGKRWNKFSTEGRKQNAGSVLKLDTLDFMYSAKGNDLSFYSFNKKVMDDFCTLGSIASSPLVNANVIYFGSTDGYLYAVHLER